MKPRYLLLPVVMVLKDLAPLAAVVFAVLAFGVAAGIV